MSVPENTINLTDLVGPHILSGVDRDTTEVQRWGDEFIKAQVLRFTLDGVTYMAVEDPDDGYRSSLDYVAISERPCSRQFEGVAVVGRMKVNGPGEEDDLSYQKNHTLQFFHATTGKLVLEAGTDNTDDYYPWYVAAFYEENLG